MSNHNKGAIIVFVKNPVLGKVKTRIAKEAGEDKALEIYKILMNYTRDIVLELDCEKYLFYAEEVNRNDEWDSKHFKKFIQSGKDLGGKMLDAFETILPKTSPTLIIGSDCPEITSADIERAFQELEDNDVVIGPAKDGGYYLLGMNDLQMFLFEDMPWSEDSLLEQTIIKVQDRGLRYSLLKTKSDVDYIEDWESLKHLVGE